MNDRHDAYMKISLDAHEAERKKSELEAQFALAAKVAAGSSGKQHMLLNSAGSRSDAPVKIESKPAKCHICQDHHTDEWVSCTFHGCARVFHDDCLPELRKRPPGSSLVDWVCPTCRREHKIAVGRLAQFLAELDLRGSLMRATGAAHDDDCSGCGLDDNPGAGDLVLCECCPRAWHAQCSPDLRARGCLPEGEWRCDTCASAAPAVAPVPATADGPSS